MTLLHERIMRLINLVGVRNYFAAAFLILGTLPLIAKPKNPLPQMNSTIAQDFLDTVCVDSAANFGEAWLKHESKHWEFYRTTYYQTEEATKLREKTVTELGSRKSDVCKNVRTFLMVAPPLMGRMAQVVADLTGHQPSLPLFFASALDWTDGCGSNFGGEKIYVLNARHDTYMRTTGLAATVVHELIHSAMYPQEESWRKRTATRNLIAESLYHEGIAVYGTQIVMPEVGFGATGLKADELIFAEKTQVDVAKKILALWSEPVSDDVLSQYFSGGWEGKAHPRKMGYYLGLKIFKQIEAEIGQKSTIRIKPQEFFAKAKNILEQMVAK